MATAEPMLVVVVLAGVLGTAVTAANWMIALRQWRARHQEGRRHVSMIPVMGGLLIAPAIYLAGKPSLSLAAALLAAAAVDPGTGSIIVAVAAWPIRALRSRTRRP